MSVILVICLPTHTVQTRLYADQIYPYWAGLCCMADIDSLTPRGIADITVQREPISPRRCIEFGNTVAAVGFENELGLPRV
jgi:hypothetical protein